MPADSTPMPAPSTATPPALLTMPLIRKHYLPLGERTIWRWIASDKFPKPDLSLGAKVRLWRRETVEKWIEENVGGAE